MQQEYQMVTKNQTRQMAQFLADYAQVLLPMVEREEAKEEVETEA